MATMNPDNHLERADRDTTDLIAPPALDTFLTPRERLAVELIQRVGEDGGRLEARIESLLNSDVEEFPLRGEFRVEDVVAEASLGESLYAVTFSSDDRYVAVGSHGGTTSLFEVKDDQLSEITTLKNSLSITALAFRPNSHQLAVGGHDRALTIASFDPESGETTILSTLDVGDSVNSIAFSPDGRHVVFGTGVREGGRVRIAAITPEGVLGGVQEVQIGGNKPAIAFSFDGELLAVGGTHIELFTVPQGGEGFASIAKGSTSVTDMTFDYDGKTLIVGGAIGGGRSVRRIRTDTLDTEESSRREYLSIRSLTLSPTGSHLAVCLESPVRSPYGRLLILDAHTLEKVAECTTTRPIKACSFSSTGDRIAVVGDNGTLWIFGKS